MSLTGRVKPLEDKPRGRCRLWELVANLPREGTRYPTRTKRFRGTYREAEAALRAFLDELEAGQPTSRSTFADYSKAWHERRVRSHAYSQRTMDREAARLVTANRHLGDMKMCEIDQADIERCHALLMDGDSPSGRHLKPWTIASVHSTISKLFADAVKSGDISENPCEGVKLPQRGAHEGRIPTTQEVDAMLRSLDMTDARHRALALCAACGLRRSEAVALEWSDFDGNSVHVKRSLDDDGRSKPTKTGETRDVPVPAFLADSLESVRRDGPIAPMMPAVLSRWWRRNRHRWDMDGVRLHDLRHAYATRLAEAGVHPRVMMQLGGWASVNVCMRIYTHVHDVTLGDAVARAFDSV